MIRPQLSTFSLKFPGHMWNFLHSAGANRLLEVDIDVIKIRLSRENSVFC